MQSREHLRQMILSMGADGREFSLDDVMSIEGIVDEKEITQKAYRTTKRHQVRSYIRAVFKAEGKKIRSVKKNVYKVVDEETFEDCQAELIRLTKLENKYSKLRNEYRDYMASKGFAVQIEMKVIRTEGSESVAEDSRKNPIRPVAGSSKKSEKAAVNG